MRTTQKRKRSNGAWRMSKRRRFVRRRFKRKGRSTTSYTTRSTGTSEAFKFRARKLSKRAYRSHLYKQTLVDPHFKSINSSLNTFNTPAAVTDVATLVTPCFPVTATSAGLAFWKVDDAIHQNVQYWTIDSTTLAPVLPNWAALGAEDPYMCIIRGGRYYININCQINNDPINVRVQLAFAKTSARTPTGNNGNTLTDWLNIIGAISPKPLTWTYQTQADYEEYFHPPILDRVVRLLPGEDVSIVKKIKPTKIVCDQHRDQGGWYPYWFIYGSQSATNVAGVSVVGCVTGYNISFSVTSQEAATT